MLMINDRMSESDRKIERVTAALVTGTVERGRIAVAYITPRNEVTRETLFCSGWKDLTPMESCIDFQPYLASENHIGIRVLGLTPEPIANDVRKAILTRLNA